MNANVINNHIPRGDPQTSLFSKLNDKTLLIVPNLRTARLLAHDYHQNQAQKPHWSSPPITALETWLQTLTTELLPYPYYLLPSAHETSVWQNIVEHKTAGTLPYESMRHLSKLAQSAWALIGEWCLDLKQLQHDIQKDVAFFYQCATAFQQRCKQQQWLSNALCHEFLLTKIDQLKALLPAELILYGFDHLTPSTKKLFDHLACNHTISYINDVPAQGVQSQITCADHKDELSQMLSWAKKTIEAHPRQRLICLVPRLHLIREKLVRMVQQYFPAQNAATQKAAITINISSGQPIITYPIIQHAFHIIRWMIQGHLQPSSLSDLLSSPYIRGAQQELSQRFLLDQLARQTSPTALNISTLQHLAQHHHCPLFAECCHQSKHTLQQCQSASQWVTSFKKVLHQAGWPGERTLNSQEHQLCKALHGIFEQLVSFDKIQSGMHVQQAIQLFKNLCQDHLFQTQSPVSQIEILGILEGSTIPCDHMWVMEMTDQLWPAKPNPHPFLPIGLQQQYNLPHASAHKELTFSQAIMQRISHHSKRIYYSYACHDGEQTQCPSPLLANIPSISACDIDNKTPEQTSNALQRFDDQQSSNITAPGHVKAGSHVLHHQANCPFQAFATHRLHAKDLIEDEKHIHAADKGSLIHITLDLFWHLVKDQRQLIALPKKQLSQTIDQCIAQAFELYTHKTRKSIHHSLLPILQDNIHQLMQQWMALEKNRPSFKVIAQEKEIHAHLAGIPIQLRPDRIDQLASGQYILIDYKTGHVSHQHWLSDRLTQPQLPLYAITYPLTLDGIAFAHVKMHQCQFSGLINGTEGLPMLTAFQTLYPNTPDSAKDGLFAKWKQQLLSIANEFLHGIASVDPQLANSCDYCHLSPLCRINLTS